jgi:hypothetical protein
LGTTPEFSEFSPTGYLRFDAGFVGGGASYRAFRFPWMGKPSRSPDIAASGNGDNGRRIR